jgi:hypothetical protein
MSTYVVEQYLPDITSEQLGAAASAAKATTASMTSERTPVRHLRSTFIPGEDKCYCLRRVFMCGLTALGGRATVASASA